VQQVQLTIWRGNSALLFGETQNRGTAKEMIDAPTRPGSGVGRSSPQANGDHYGCFPAPKWPLRSSQGLLDITHFAGRHRTVIGQQTIKIEYLPIPGEPLDRPLDDISDRRVTRPPNPQFSNRDVRFCDMSNIRSC